MPRDSAPSLALFDECLDTARLQAAAGDYLGATRLLDESLKLCPSSDEGRRARALALMAHNYPRLGNLQASVRCASEAVALCERSGVDDAVLADALSSLSYVHAQLLMGRDALDCGLRALAAARRAHDDLREGWALNRIGVAYSSLGNPAQSCELTRQAVAAASRLDPRALAAQELSFSCCNNLAYFWLIRVADARRAGDESALAEACEQALLLSEQATALARASASPFQISVAVSNLVEALLARRAFDAAAPLLAEFELLSQTHGYLSLELQAAAQRALVLKAHGDFAGALMGLHELLARPHRGGLPPKLRRILVHALYETHKANAEHAQALSYLEQHVELERQLALETQALQSEVLLIRQEVDLAQTRVEHALADAQRERERAHRLEREQQQLRDQAMALDRAAHEDVLTGLHNRRHAEVALPLLVEGARLAGQPISLAMLDVDHFKRVNDDFGHAVGDAVLQQLALLLRGKIRDADLLARVGGEEFLFVLVGTPVAQAREICERLRQAVAAHDWPSIAPGLQVHISIGLAGGTPPEESRLLLERSDHALYTAKRGGRDRVHVDATAAAQFAG